ncbi:MAG TPA: FHA domain-containing protein [Anaerolineales bacterium]|nr:FHA domain-containing protein [Anaerolineales bacterium]
MPAVDLHQKESGTTRTMTSVVVTLKVSTGESRDLELPADVPLGLLAQATAMAIGHAENPSDTQVVKYVLKYPESDRALPLDATLESAGVVHGDILLLLKKVLPASVATSESGLRFGGPGFIATTGRPFPLVSATSLVGRADRASGLDPRVMGVDLAPLDADGPPSVSRRHAQILFRKGDYLLQDLKSRNGTVVNGRALRPGDRVRLMHGDEVRFGDVALIFVWDSQEDAEV